jgi:hypothetical protein
MLLNVSRSTNSRFFLLAPSTASLRPFSGKVVVSNQLHSRLLADAQRLRGRVYVDDGALEPSDLTADGRHISHIDDESWHLLSMTPSGRLAGCTRFRQHPNTVHAGELGVSHIPLARSKEWARGFRASLDSELDAARSIGFSYVEIGGWVLHPQFRGTSAALVSVLATYAWSHIQGGALGVSTATERNGSAAILRKLGGRSLEWDGAALPPYFDRAYNCMMEILRFDSRRPNPRYARMIEALTAKLLKCPIFCPGVRTKSSHARHSRTHWTASLGLEAAEAAA